MGKVRMMRRRRPTKEAEADKRGGGGRKKLMQIADCAGWPGTLVFPTSETTRHRPEWKVFRMKPKKSPSGEAVEVRSLRTPHNVTKKKTGKKAGDVEESVLIRGKSSATKQK